MAPQTPAKESAHTREALDLTWFPYPTPGGNQRIEELDEGPSINLGESSSSSDEEANIEPVEEDSDFVVQDDELMGEDESYVPTTPSSNNGDFTDKDVSPAQPDSKKRPIPSTDGIVKRRRLLMNGTEATTGLDYIINVEDGAEENAAGKWTDLVDEFTTGRYRSAPGPYFINLKRENREVHAYTGIEFPPELLAALDEVSAQVPHGGGPAAAAITAGISAFARPCRLYLPAEESNFAAPATRVLNATADLELANEVALARFRELCREHFPGIATEWLGVFAPGPGDAWIRARGDIRRRGKLAWWVERGCVAVCAAMPGTERQIAVRVIIRRIVSRDG